MPQHAARSDPGGDTFDDIAFLVESGLNKDRDQIALGRHGNLYDLPNLACPQLDLSACNTSENAADFADLQRVATAGPGPAPIVSGAFDVTTGSSGAKDVARDPSRPTAVQIPGIGHGWSRSRGAHDVSPTAPDTDCVDGLEPNRSGSSRNDQEGRWHSTLHPVGAAPHDGSWPRRPAW
ncbi:MULTISPECIES: hypothetical protein [Streptomyces]|uniref:Peptidase S33 tripeptidyl aminopeptidase-like C-terminal domain-containing protein n=1 Tax=Streptomyces virginiae TaxID=1961 RepID=A0ABZ1TME2_STRVG|nr:hypothetical protein [Streptomyces virginiae]